MTALVFTWMFIIVGLLLMIALITFVFKHKLFIGASIEPYQNAIWTLAILSMLNLAIGAMFYSCVTE